MKASYRWLRELVSGFAGSPAAASVVYRAPDRRLTVAEVDAQHAKVVAEVGGRFGATLR
jgi:phenylalanyl-tRNA synthetase beta subunit